MSPQFKFVLDGNWNSVQYLTGIIWMALYITMLQLFLKLPWTIVRRLFVPNDLIQILWLMGGRWAHTLAHLEFIMMVGMSQASNYWQQHIWMEYKEFYSSNLNLHYFKYHTLFHQPPLHPHINPLQNISRSAYNHSLLHTCRHYMVSRDYLCWTNLLYSNLLPYRYSHFKQI